MKPGKAYKAKLYCSPLCLGVRRLYCSARSSFTKGVGQYFCCLFTSAAPCFQKCADRFTRHENQPRVLHDSSSIGSARKPAFVPLCHASCTTSEVRTFVVCLLCCHDDLRADITARISSRSEDPEPTFRLHALHIAFKVHVAGYGECWSVGRSTQHQHHQFIRL